MRENLSGGNQVERRTFVKATLAPPALAAPLFLARTVAGSAPREPESSASFRPEIVDTNVHLFDWPFRKLKYARTPALIAKLRRHRITQAWAGSFEALLHRQFDVVNRRLADECRRHGGGMLVPIGSVNPAQPGWEADLEACRGEHQMPGVRLYPSYHGYTLDHPQFRRLLEVTARHGMLVQIALRMEDERVHHPSLVASTVNLTPLADLLAAIPKTRVQLINAAGPLLGRTITDLVQRTQVSFGIAACEGNGGVGKLIRGENYSYRGAIPATRLCFGSHAPFFPCESAVLKLFESPLTREQLQQIMFANAQRLLS